MNYSVKQVVWEDLEFPPTVYKYRSWADKYHKKILTHREIYMAPPSSFEDKLDCKNSIRYDLLTTEQIYDWYYNASKSRNKGYSESQLEIPLKLTPCFRS